MYVSVKTVSGLYVYYQYNNIWEPVLIQGVSVMLFRLENRIELGYTHFCFCFIFVIFANETNLLT